MARYASSVYFLLNKAHEFIRTVLEMVSEMMKKLMKTVGVFDIFSLKTITAFKGDALFSFFFFFKQRICLHELSAALITAGLCLNCNV